VGGEIYQGVSSSNAAGANAQAQNDAAKVQQQLQQQQAAAQKQQAIQGQVANAQERTGGSLTTPGLTDLASIFAGYGGQAGGGTSPMPFSPQTTGAANPSTPGLQDALTQLTPTTQPTQANFSGGS
jgi:hypothetical protein